MDRQELERLRSAINDPMYMKKAIETIADDVVTAHTKLSCAEGEKYCPMCKMTKPLSDFYNKTDGTKQSYCKPCYVVKGKLRRMKKHES